MNFKYLCQQYDLGRFLDASELKPGTASRVWKMDTEGGVFLVRTLRDREQGEREGMIVRCLRAAGFDRCPAVLTTAQGAPMTALDGVWYQVQEYCPGTRPDPAAPGIAGAIARTVKELTLSLAHCPFIDGADRFDLAGAWQRGKEYWPLLETGMTLQQAEQMVLRCCTILEQDVQVIHGDLGPWNMMVDGQGAVSVIDFGEARMGDPYFDYASALGGIINHTGPEGRVSACRGFLAVLDPDRDRLLEQLRLWVWRGLAQWAILAGNGVPGAKMAARFINALHWAEENLYDL